MPSMDIALVNVSYKMCSELKIPSVAEWDLGIVHVDINATGSCFKFFSNHVLLAHNELCN